MQKSYALLWVRCIPVAVCVLVVFAGTLGGVYALRARKAENEAGTPAKRIRPEARRTAAGRWASMQGASVLDNQSVVAMTQTQLSPRTLVKAIERSGCRFDMSPSAIIRMKTAGVQDDVIYAMLNNLDQCEAPTATTSAVDAHLQERLSSAIATELVAPVQ